MGNADSNKRSSIVDPIHGVMNFNEEDKKLLKIFIDDPMFQRLRHIKQLALGDFAFPGAVHTRFNHCIGTWFICKKICEQLEIDEDNAKHVCLAALLHDIGHGPFSHAFEKIYPENKEIKHEKWTHYFLQEYNSKIPDQQRIDFSFIEYLITGEPKTENDNMKILLHNLISSQLDVDRFDYLLRDSYFCGVQYGHFDLNWLIHSLFLKKKWNKKHLVIHHKGIGCIEHYLMARRLMTKNIYFNSKKCAAEYLIQCFIKQLMKCHNNDEIENSNLKAFVGEAKKYMSENNDGYALSDFCKKTFGYYKSLTDDDIFNIAYHIHNSGSESLKALADLAKDLITHQLPHVYHIQHLHGSLAKECVEYYKNQQNYEDWKICFHSPNFETYKYDKHDIKIYYEDKHWHEFSDDSLVMSLMAGKIEQMKFLMIHRTIIENENIKKMLKELKKMHAITDFAGQQLKDQEEDDD